MDVTDVEGPTVAATPGAPAVTERHAATPYQLGEVIGTGGMGEVVVAHDPSFGRDVALKRMRAEAPTDDAIARFLREAKIQARLDHPAIVPVHELGKDADGLPYFTMKRVTGTTLAAVLATAEATPQRLLRAFVDVCLAVDLAHARRVVHRDLKPSNIMLGDYGEVYVLDWGVARVLDHTEDEHSSDDIAPIGDGTRDGQLLGTPGYMAPEQVRGTPVGPAADVYALGSMLFEILAGEALHPRGHAALASTLGEIERSPARRRPTRAIAPELDAACAAALADDPRARPTARALGDRVQQYLDGDRDVEHRRELAAALVAQGRAALATGERAEAVRLGGRALALDPASTSAAALVMSLVLEPPEVLPAELAAAVAAEEARGIGQRSRRAILPYATMFTVLLPAGLLIGVRSWPIMIGLLATSLLMVGIALHNWRIRPVPVAVTMTAHLVVVAMMSQLAGPFVITPIALCAILLSATQVPWVDDRRWFVIGWTALAVMTPFVLDGLGVFTPTTTLTPDGLLIHGNVFDAAPASKFGLLGVGNLFALIVIALYARRIGHDRRVAQRRLQVQAWHLRQLLPRA